VSANSATNPNRPSSDELFLGYASTGLWLANTLYPAFLLRKPDAHQPAGQLTMRMDFHRCLSASAAWSKLLRHCEGTQGYWHRHDRPPTRPEANSCSRLDAEDLPAFLPDAKRASVASQFKECIHSSYTLFMVDCTANADTAVQRVATPARRSLPPRGIRVRYGYRWTLSS